MLSDYGWDAARARAFAPHHAQGLVPARIIAQHRGRWRIAGDAGEASAELTGRYAFSGEPHPVVGDFVAVAVVTDGPALIHALLPRAGVFVRRAAGQEAPQAVAANVDLALIVMALNADFNLRRVERYIAMAAAGGAVPLVVLTKADLVADAEPFRAAVRGAEAIVLSALTGAGVAALAARLAPGRTAAVVGSSGAGKSTLVNALCGTERMATGAIRDDDGRGRHTTTHREMIVLPSGALLIDTPGMRELGLWDAEDGLAAAFTDVEAVIARCRFADCGHASEPGCAVQAALGDGRLDPARWRAWQKLAREAAHEARKDDPKARAAMMAVWARRRKDHRAQKKMRDREDGW